MHQAAHSKQPETTISLGDVLSMVRRRLPLILILTTIGMTIGGAVVYLLPDVFEAKAVVYIEAARVPETYKKTGYIVPRLSQIVGILSKEVLSRETLGGIVGELDLYDQKSLGPSHGPATFDPVERARKDIKVDLTKRFNDDFVEISARARTALLAVKAVNRISDVLSAKNQALRLKQEQDAKAFVESQIVGAQRRMQEAESALARFKEANQESLPENNAMLLDRISKLRFDKSMAQDRLQKSQLGLAELQRRIDAVRSGAPAPASAGEGSPERRALEQELARLLAEESALLARGYGDGMPSLKRVRANLKRIREQLDGSAPSPDGSGAPADDDRIRVLTAQIAETSGIVTLIERELEHNAAETARLEMLRSSAVQIRSQLDKVQSAATEAGEEYKVLATDLRDIEKLIATEEAGRTDQFRTIEAASLDAAQFPVSPNRPVFLAAALAASLGLALGTAYLLDLARPAYREVQDLEADLHIDVLATLPEIPEVAVEVLVARPIVAAAAGAAGAAGARS